MNKIKTAYSNMEATMSKWSSHGASDSEPYWKLTTLLEKALNGRPTNDNSSAEEWQLFTCSMKCGTAARALNSSWKKLRKSIDTGSFRDVVEFKDWVGIE